MGSFIHLESSVTMLDLFTVEDFYQHLKLAQEQGDLAYLAVAEGNRA